MFKDSIVVSTRQGKFKVLTSDGVISRSLFCTGQFEEELMRAYLDFLHEKKLLPKRGSGTFLDVGANIGISSISVLNAHEFEKTISIEPEPKNFLLLQHNATINKLNDKMQCVQYAASNERSELSFELSSDNFGDHRVRKSALSSTERFNESERKLITVPGDSLDTIIENIVKIPVSDISLVWIDVQGYEGYVFRGARKIFAHAPVVSEIWPYGIQRSGTTLQEFCEITKEIWTHYYVPRISMSKQTSIFVEYPIETLQFLLNELPGKEDYHNLIFVNKNATTVNN